MIPMTATGVAERAPWLRPQLVLPALLLILLSSWVSGPGTGGAPAPAVSDPASSELEAQLLDDYASLPLSFEPNLGQSDADADYLTRGSGYSFFLTASEAVLSFDPSPSRDAGESSAPSMVRTRFLGADPEARSRALEELPGKVNYFIGDRSADWHTGIPTYARVMYEEIYPGIDLVYYGNQDRLEYDLVVAPGADTNDIRLSFRGADKVSIGRDGDLIVSKRDRDLRWEKPVIYQRLGDGRRGVSGSYVLTGRSEVAFEVGPYDPDRTLVIDPVLAYSTYFGGSDLDEGEAIAVDGDGSAYITGTTRSADLPTLNPPQPTLGGLNDAFVAKLSPTGDALVYSTYVGGTDEEKPRSVAIDGSGNAYLGGATTSTDFPTVNAYQASNAGNQDAYITKLNPTGDALVFSTYLGGSNNDARTNLAADSEGNVYVSGYTYSKDFPTLNPIQSQKGSRTDFFVTKLAAQGDTLVYSTFLGGNHHDTGRGITVDTEGSAYVIGWTFSTDFPTVNAFQPTYAGLGDVVLFKLDPSGGSLVYSTYLGGTDEDMTYLGDAVAVDGSGAAYLTGFTDSNDFPTVNPVQASYAGNQDAFAAKLNPTGDGLVYSTYLGGAGKDEGTAVAVDGSGAAHVTGYTSSSDFPTVNAFQPGYGGTRDAFLTKLPPEGNPIEYSSFLGGSREEQGLGVAVDSEGSAYLVGKTGSTNFPVLSALQPTSGGKSDAFVAKIAAGDSSTPPPSSDTTPPTVSMKKPKADELLNDTGLSVRWSGEDDVGIAYYEVYEGVGTAGAKSLVQSSTATSYGRTGVPGTTYCYQVLAYDTSGNVGSGEERCAAVPYDDASAGIVYTGAVIQVTAATAYEGTLTVLDGDGQQAGLSFTGRRVGVLVRRAPDSGRADVYLDGVFKKTIDLYASSTREKIYEFNTALPAGPHSIGFVWTGTKNSSSSGTALSLDGIAVVAE